MAHIAAIRVKERDRSGRIKFRYRAASVMRRIMTFGRLQRPIDALHDHTKTVQAAPVILRGQCLGLLETWNTRIQATLKLRLKKIMYILRRLFVQRRLYLIPFCCV